MDAKPFRRLLRQQSTAAEAMLWCRFRNRRFMQLKIRRQHSIGKYIVDFYCEELKLIIEVDGKVHDNLVQANYDYDRDQCLRSQGYSIYRVDNDSALNYWEVAREDLARFIAEIRKRLESKAGV